MNILVTGGAGYLGSTLVLRLPRSGYEVTVVDRFFFDETTLRASGNESGLSLIHTNSRWSDGRLVDGEEAVVDLAAVSKDPASALNPWQIHEVNHPCRPRVASLAKEVKLARYLAASSCSVHGMQCG